MPKIRNKASLKNYSHPSHKWDQIKIPESQKYLRNFRWKCRNCDVVVTYDSVAQLFYGPAATFSCKIGIVSQIMGS